MQELIGARLGQYKVKEHIATGGMASVYLAHQASMNRDVAIKVLPSDLTKDESFLERFYVEVEVIAQLQHPHILPVYDFGTHENQPYIVMAYLGGGTLADKMAKGMLTFKEIIRITHQIAEALDFAHSKGIIHRDFKPGNVLMDDIGNAYLADFGLAKITESESDITQMSIMGTPAYMAPEQAQGEDPTSAVDIYAFGITIYEMLTGDIPFPAKSLTAIMLAHIQDPIPDITLSRPDLPNAVQDVIDKCLAKAPDERYPTAGELAQDLQVNLQGTPAPDLMEGFIPQPALVMTNMLGQVIFVDNQCLNLIKRHHSEARNIMGKPISEVLGIDDAIAKQLLNKINTQGQLEDTELEIKNSRGNPHHVICTAVATRDQKGAFVGADIRLLPLPKDADAPPSSEFLTAQLTVNTQEQTYLQDYFVAQLEALYNLCANWGGKKIANHFEQTINDIAQRNVWSLSMEKGKIIVELKQTDIDMYKALIARGINYVAHILGNKQVIKEMEYVNKQTHPDTLNFIKMLGLDKLYHDILG